MNDRQRFHATMRYQQRDRAPIYDFSFWPETIAIWKEQGLPQQVTRANAAEYFGMDQSLATLEDELNDPLFASGIDVGLVPLFERKVIEDRGDHELVQQPDGVRVLRKKFLGSIPVHEGHLLTDRRSWNQYYKPKLDPTHRIAFRPIGTSESNGCPTQIANRSSLSRAEVYTVGFETGWDLKTLH